MCVDAALVGIKNIGNVEIQEKKSKVQMKDDKKLQRLSAYSMVFSPIG